MLDAFANCSPLLSAAQHETDAEVFKKAYEAYVDEVLEEELVQPLCTAIENDLRVHVHSVHGALPTPSTGPNVPAGHSVHRAPVMPGLHGH